jgi:hypothetical protein
MKGQRFPLYTPYDVRHDHVEVVEDCDVGKDGVVMCCITTSGPVFTCGTEHGTNPVPVKVSDICLQAGYDIKASASMLDLLNVGGSITLPWGYEIIGVPRNQTLLCVKIDDQNRKYSDGLRNLSREGLEYALLAARFWLMDKEGR